MENEVFWAGERMVAVRFRGEVSSVSALARTHGVPHHVIRKRLRDGWDMERAITTPHDPTLKNGKPRRRASKVSITYLGETLTIADVAERTKLPRSVIYGRVSNGWRASEIMKTPLRPAGERHLGRLG
jgi:transposase-like protein